MRGAEISWLESRFDAWYIKWGLGGLHQVKSMLHHRRLNRVELSLPRTSVWMVILRGSYGYDIVGTFFLDFIVLGLARFVWNLELGSGSGTNIWYPRDCESTLINQITSLHIYFRTRTYTFQCLDRHYRGVVEGQRYGTNTYTLVLTLE